MVRVNIIVKVRVNSNVSGYFRVRVNVGVNLKLSHADCLEPCVFECFVSVRVII